ncbi:MAG: hypothetical protein IPK80_28625 [Nannocystis sp.]|nr:hypothetical protein [Nannocystis sp.]
MAFDYLRANGRRVGLDRDFSSYDLNIQVMSQMHGRDTPDLGVAFFIAILSAMVGRNIGAGLVVLGQMSIHGVLSRIDNLADRLRIAMDSGAHRVMIPTTNAADPERAPRLTVDQLLR